MRKLMLCALALAGAVYADPPPYVTKVGTPATNAATVQTDPAHPLAITGSITANSAGASDTVGNNATFNANAVCATVLLTGQPGAGFFLAAGTLAATLTPSISEDATPAAPGCTGGNWTASSFVDISGNTSATLVLTNPNAFQHFGVKTLAGSRCARICTTSHTGGSAVGNLVATVATSPSPAPSADVTDRAGRLLGKVYGSDGFQIATANSGRPQVDIITGGGSNASVGTNGAAAPGSSSEAGAVDGSGNLTGVRAFDADSGAGTQNVLGTVLRKSASGGSVEAGTSTDPLRTDPTGTTTQPISASSLPLPTGAATETTLSGIKTGTDKIPASPSTDRTTAAGPFSTRLSDGAAFYDAAKTGQLPAALDGSGFLKVHEQGTATVAGTVTANVGTTNGLALDATLTGGTAKEIVRGGAKGATSAADVTSTANGTDHQALDVQLWLSGSALDPRTRTWNLGASDVPDLSDRAARLLGVVYGSQAQQLKQTATNFNLQVELAVGGTLIDPRSIRALTSSDTVTVVQGTGTNLHIVCDSGCSSSAGFADLGAFTTGTTAINPVGGLFDDTPPTAVTTGKAAAARITANRALHINLRNAAGTEIGTSGAPVRTDPTGSTTQPVSGTVTANIGTSGSLALDASVTGLQVSQGSATSGQKGGLAQGAVTTAAPTYTTGNTNPLSLNLAGGLRVDGSGVTQPVSGTVTTTPPANASTNVTQFGSTNVATGTGASGAGIPRVTVANDSNVLATQSGTWTVQPGNTANTTAWKVDGSAVTQPVSGTVTVNQGSPPWTTDLIRINGTTILTGAGVSGAGAQRVAVATSDGAVLSTANTGRLQVDVVTGGGSNASIGTDGTAPPGSETLVGATVVAAPPSYTAGQMKSPTLDTTGNLRAISEITDGEFGSNQAKVLGPAQAPQAKDSAVVVAISPNTPINVVNIGTNRSPLVQASPLLPPTIRSQIVDPSGRPATVLGPRQVPTGSENAQVFIQSPIPVPTCPQQAALSQTASTTVIPGSAGKTTYICKVFIVSTTAQSVSLTEGTGTACGTGGAALAGHTTVANGMALAANGGWVEGSGAGIVYTAKKLGDDICVLQSGAGNVAGSISYVQF
jgi:hypothetical protein